MSYEILNVIVKVVEKTGVRRTDPRLNGMMTKLEKYRQSIGYENTSIENLELDQQTFSRYKINL